MSKIFAMLSRSTLASSAEAMLAAQTRMLMYRSVFEAPRELSRRRVLADWLLEHNDPHGEFISLQFETSSRARQRASKLLRRHRAAFLGPLARYATEHQAETWEHGFVTRAVMRFELGLLNEPAMATLVWARVSRADPRVFTSPWLHGLEHLEVWPELEAAARSSRAKVMSRRF